MKAGAERPTGWITKTELFACLAATGAGDITEHQLERWRGEGLLPRVDQDPLKGHGSVVRYPPGSCEQIREIRRLFAIKNRIGFVRDWLWLNGFQVEEKYWRPKLMIAGKWMDRAQRFIDWLNARFEQKEETLADASANVLVNNNILSRIIGRLNVEELKTFSRVVIDIGLGTFDGFEAPVAGQNRKFDEEGLIRNLDEVGQNRTIDERVSIKALDIEPSAIHAILGKKLNFVEILPRVLSDVSTAFSMGGFEKAATGAECSLAAARADARNALIIAMSLYEGFSWVYGPRAFGLRFAHLLARKAPAAAIRTILLAVVRLRAVPDALLPSDKIAQMARHALQMRAASLRLKHVGETDPRFRDVLSPRRVRRAFVDPISRNQWLNEIAAARMSERDKHRPGG